LGAHPDDAEFQAGGLAAKYRQAGHVVKLVSVTYGAAGHYQTFGPPLAAGRKQEAAAAGRVIGAEYVTWDFPDGSLVPSLEVRLQIIREIRSFQPDLVLTHRPCDYHPDHRAVGAAVQDASYLVTVPAVAPETPALRRDPVVAYMPDLFTRPSPLRPDVLIDFSEHLETVVQMLACHRSQVFEWLPYNKGAAEELPADEEQRLAWLRGWLDARLRERADHFRDATIAAFGDRGRSVTCLEVFEISEYAAPLDAAARERLFGT
ncbi:MAG: PIG-L family deacetylase, partial [Planctomycetes bacterium]|nr:PIG-L family deacetylase [Planctomycetota bacterium]